jgi:hypothetical protein
MPRVILMPSNASSTNARDAVHVEGRLQIRERLAEPMFGSEELGANDAEHGEDQAKPLILLSHKNST